MQRDNKKVALITGASRGIGATVAVRLAAEGFTTIIHYSGDAAPAEAVARGIEDHGGRAVTAQADVADAAAVRAMFASVEAAFGGIDLLVNSGGVMHLAPLAETDDESFDRQVAVNFKGSFNTLREAGARLRDGGRIVSISSGVGGLLQPGHGVHAATKAAIEALTSVLAKELRGRNITVNAIAPGPTATEAFLHGRSPAAVERLRRLSPLERLGQPEDIAAAVAFLAGPDGGWINGQTLRADGGMI
jgi:3-oxoacyl-[acyl-carrier protein] reductase